MKLSLLTLFASILSVSSQEVVTIPDGTKFKGTSNGVSRSFKGIRYAESPVGKSRWAPPVPYSYRNVNEIVDATKFGSHCIQSVWPNGSEDCLFLNVFVTENVKSEAALPVLIFIHGGSYISGSSKFYSGEDMVEFWGGSAIVVTLDYRLNVFGFIGSAELREQDKENGSCGNYGLQDQRMGFDWVWKNIGAFGGDPARITIMGESAGGGSVSNHLSMKKSWPYFTSAIIESGSFGQWTAQPMSRAQAVYDELLVSTNCSNLDCLLALNTEEVYNAYLTTTETSKYLSPFAPTADGVELLTHPWIALNNGDVADVPVLHGTNADEGILFTALDQRKHVTEVELISYWRDEMNFSSVDISQLMELYVDGKEESYPSTNHEGITSVYWWALQRSVGDYMFSCPAKHASTHLAPSSMRHSENYVYHFEYTSLMSHFAIHSSEMPYVFHWRLGMTSNAEVANMLSSFWGNFVMSETHDPNIDMIPVITISSENDTLPFWPTYSRDTDEVLVLNVKDKTIPITALKAEECKFHIRNMEEEIHMDFGK